MENEKLNAETAYEIGKFWIVLNEKGGLKIVSTTLREKIHVIPESNNCVIINSSR